LDYWEATTGIADYQIGRWGNKASKIPKKIYINKRNTNSKFYFTQGFTHAVSQWNTALECEMSTVTFSGKTPPSAAKISFFGGTESELNELKLFGNIPLSVSGRILTKNRSKEGTWTYGNKNVTGWKYKEITGFAKDMDYTEDQYKQTCAHELGHALGWYGHSPRMDMLMGPPGSSPTTVTTRDKRHLYQVYH